MFPGHPWQGEPFGEAEYEWFLSRSYEAGVLFEVNMEPFVAFCKSGGHQANRLVMKVCTRLSSQRLPQYLLALNGRPYPARYPAGYVRQPRPDSDMLEHVAVREKDEGFSERLVRAHWKKVPLWFAHKHPRIGTMLARFFPGEEVKDNYALMVTRNPLRKLNTRVIVVGSHVRTMALAIPFGKKVFCSFYFPHAFGNINFFEPFLLGFKTWMEDPEQIPAELLNKPYREVPTAPAP